MATESLKSYPPWPVLDVQTMSSSSFERLSDFRIDEEEALISVSNTNVLSFHGKNARRELTDIDAKAKAVSNVF